MAIVNFLSGETPGDYILEINGKMEGFISLEYHFSSRGNFGFKYGDTHALLSFLFPAIYSVEKTSDYQKYKIVNHSAGRIEGYIDIYPISKQIIFIKED